MKKNNLHKIVIAMSMASMLLMPSLSAQAIEYQGFGGRPTYPDASNPRTSSIFVHTLLPGVTQTEGVTVINNTTVAKTLMVYGADSTPSSDGAFACKQLAEPKTDVGAWINLERSEVTLNPGTNQIVPFTIVVPASASVGEHDGCILIQEKKDPVEGQSGAILSVRTGLRVSVTVPGDIIRDVTPTGFTVTPESGVWILQPSAKNTGNVSIDTEVKVTTTDFMGLTHVTDGGKYPILPGDTSTWNFELKKPFWGGWYTSTTTFQYDPNPGASVGVQSGGSLITLSREPVWFFSPPTLVAFIIEIGVVLLIILAIIVLLVARRRRIMIKNSWVDHEVKAGDDIESLAEKFHTSWQMLVKVNKLKAPYALSVGEVVKVPPKAGPAVAVKASAKR